MLDQLKRVSGALRKIAGQNPKPAAAERCPAWHPKNRVEQMESVVCDIGFEYDAENLQPALDFFEKNGYVLLKNAVSKNDCDAVVEAIFSFLGMSRNDPAGWYRDDRPANGMVELYQHPAMWRIRESPAIHGISAALIGTPELWTSMDRMNFKPPVHPDHPRHDSSAFIHWDMDSTNIPDQRFLQGVVMLEDTDETMGGFQCVPGLFGKNLQEWVKTQPADRDPFFPDLNTLPPGMKVTVVPAHARDYIVWDSTLVHGSGRNLSDRPRFAQYVSQQIRPVGAERERERGLRITAYQERTCVPFEHHRGDPTEWEKKNYPPPPLTEHGQKLLGLKDW